MKQRPEGHMANLHHNNNTFTILYFNSTFTFTWHNTLTDILTFYTLTSAALIGVGPAGNS